MTERGVTEAHVRAVLAIDDRVLRNYWVTQSYADVSVALAQLLGADTCNWCTFAAWASRTVGENLRGEGLPEWLHDRVTGDDGMMGALRQARPRRAGGEEVAGLDDRAPDHIMDVVRDAFGATALNLSDGNTVVYAEIGLVAACLLEGYGPTSTLTRAEAKSQVLAACAAAAPFEDVNRLEAGFSSWCDAIDTTDPRRRSQQILAGSLQLGIHEQNRLQAAVAGSMDMGVNQLTTRVAHRLAQDSGWLAPLVRELEHALLPVTDSVARVWDDVMTEFVGVVDSPDGKLRLGHDVPPLAGGRFAPADLDQPWLDELVVLQQRFDRSDGAGQGSAADDWVSLDDRMNFILNLFRSRHHHSPMFDPPFPPEVVVQLEADVIPTPSGG